MNRDFSILLQRDIYDILIGDADVVLDADPALHMPYYKGHELISLCCRFGCQTDVSQSRWYHMDVLLNYCIAENKISDILSYLFDFSRFRNTVSKIDTCEKKQHMYKLITESALDEINKYLVFDQKKLVKLSNIFQIQDVSAPVIVKSEPLQSIDLDYIQQLLPRIQKDLDNGDYDSVLTKSRTLAEEVLIHILEESKEQDIPKENIVNLIKKVQATLNMQKSNNFDDRINAMLSGLNKTIQAVIELRNKQGDAHGQGSKRITIRKREAMLVANATITYLSYVFSVYLDQKKS